MWRHQDCHLMLISASHWKCFTAHVWTFKSPSIKNYVLMEQQTKMLFIFFFCVFQSCLTCPNYNWEKHFQFYFPDNSQKIYEIKNILSFLIWFNSLKPYIFGNIFFVMSEQSVLYLLFGGGPLPSSPPAFQPDKPVLEITCSLRLWAINLHKAATTIEEADKQNSPIVTRTNNFIFLWLLLLQWVYKAH